MNAEEPVKRSFYKTDYEAVTRELSRYDWPDILNGNFQEDYKKFFDILEDIMVKHTPLKTPHKKKKNRLDISGDACHNCEKGCGVDAVKGTISDTSLIDS